MLSHEWRELEVLCERISDLRHRYAFAQRTKNVGLVDGLKNDIATAKRQRERLVQHISARLSSVTAAKTRGVRLNTESETPASEPEATYPNGSATAAAVEAASAMMVGFHDE